MRSVVTTFLLLLGCLLNQVLYQSAPLPGGEHGSGAIVARPTAAGLVLKTSDAARFPKLAETLLTTYVVSQVVSASFAGLTDDVEIRAGKLRPTLQSLDVRLQV